MQDPPTRGDQLGRVAPEGGEGVSGFAGQARLVDAAGPRNVSETLDRMHPRNIPPRRYWVLHRVCAIFAAVPNDPASDLSIATDGGDTQTLSQWLTTFNMLAVVIDPYTYESGWILPTADRLFQHYDEADIRCCFIVASDGDGARQYLGKFASQYLVLVDPERELIRSLGLERLPALIHLGQGCNLLGSAEGWDPGEWRTVIDGVESAMAWRSRPLIPTAKDPGAFEGTPALDG